MRAMKTPYAGGAQEREHSEPRLASDTSYNGVAPAICEQSDEGAAGNPYAGSAQESKPEVPLDWQAERRILPNTFSRFMSRRRNESDEDLINHSDYCRRKDIE